MAAKGQIDLVGAAPGGATRPRACGYAVEVVSSTEALRELKEDWNRLVEATKNESVFSSFDWVWNWWRHIGTDESCLGPKRLLVLAVRRGSRTIGLAPFLIRSVSRRGFAVRKVEFIGCTFNDYNDLLLDPGHPSQVEPILNCLRAHSPHWDVVDLRSMPADSPTPASMAEALKSEEVVYRLGPDDPCPYIDLQTNWEGLLRTFSRDTRMTFRNQANRLKRLESEGLRTRLIDNPREEPDVLERIVATEMRRQVRGRPGNRLIAATKSFFETLFQSLGPTRRIYVALMEMNSNLIAYQIGFRCGDKLWNYATGFDPRYAQWSPGKMLIPAVLDYGFEDGCREYDFLRGDEPYKQKWTKEKHETLRLRIWKPEWRSRLKARLYFDLRTRVYRSRLLSRLGFPYVPEGEV